MHRNRHWKVRLQEFSLFPIRDLEGSFIPYQIKDSIWLSNGSLLIAAGHQLLLYGSPSPSPGSTPNPLSETLFEYAAQQNGPLDDYHPQIMLQCLLWGE